MPPLDRDGTMPTMSDRTSRHADGVPHVVIAGGGVAALEGVLALRAVAGEAVTVEVVATEQDFVIEALSVAGPFLADEVRRYPLGELVAAAGGRLRRAQVTSVDSARHAVTTAEDEVTYDALLLALGAVSRPALEGALTFRGPEDEQALTDLLDALVTGSARRLAFVLPPAPTRQLPLYELALETQSFLADRGAHQVAITIVTPESSLFSAFGSGAGDELGQLLADRNIQLVASAEVEGYTAGELLLGDGRSIPADHVVAMAGLEGRHLPGIPWDADGFVPVDDHCRVVGMDDVYAAGDMTSFPVRHGGIAAQQADAAMETIACNLGFPIDPRPFHPVVRGQLLTGMFPRYLRLDADDPGETLSTVAPWWPPAKIVGRYLTPFLAKQLGIARTDLPDGAESDDRVLEWRAGNGWTPI
jgi:sulfide:quinone oxidoreductase